MPDDTPPAKHPAYPVMCGLDWVYVIVGETGFVFRTFETLAAALAAVEGKYLSEAAAASSFAKRLRRLRQADLGVAPEISDCPAEVEMAWLTVRNRAGHPSPVVVVRWSGGGAWPNSFTDPTTALVTIAEVLAELKSKRECS